MTIRTFKELMVAVWGAQCNTALRWNKLLQCNVAITDEFADHCWEAEWKLSIVCCMITDLTAAECLLEGCFNGAEVHIVQNVHCEATNNIKVGKTNVKAGEEVDAMKRGKLLPLRLVRTVEDTRSSHLVIFVRPKTRYSVGLSSILGPGVAVSSTLLLPCLLPGASISVALIIATHVLLLALWLPLFFFLLLLLQLLVLHAVVIIGNVRIEPVSCRHHSRVLHINVVGSKHLCGR